MSLSGRVPGRFALRALTREDLTNRMCAHGAIVHGFTPTWYDPARLAGMAEACAA